MDSSWVAPILLAALGIVASCVGGLIWVVKYLLEQMMPVQREIKTSIDKNTKVTENSAKLWGKATDSMKNVANQVEKVAGELANVNNGPRTEP